VEVFPGDLVNAVISANLVGEDYVWGWDTRVVSGRDAPTVKASFSQSSFFGAPLSLARLRKRATGHMPVLNADGEVQQWLLSLFGGHRSLQQIADELVRRFPDRFKGRQEALAAAADVAVKYSR